MSQSRVRPRKVDGSVGYPHGGHVGGARVAEGGRYLGREGDAGFHVARHAAVIGVQLEGELVVDGGEGRTLLDNDVEVVLGKTPVRVDRGDDITMTTWVQRRNMYEFWG